MLIATLLILIRSLIQPWHILQVKNLAKTQPPGKRTAHKTPMVHHNTMQSHMESPAGLSHLKQILASPDTWDKESLTSCYIITLIQIVYMYSSYLQSYPEKLTFRLVTFQPPIQIVVFY